MANEFYTLVVVPHAKARFRRFQVSVKFTKWLLGVSGGLVLLGSGVMVHFTRLATEVYSLRAQNRILAAKTQEYERSAVQLQAKIGDLQNVVTKLGVMAGLE